MSIPIPEHKALKILFTNFEEKITTWEQYGVYAPYWRIWYNFQPGGLISIDGKEYLPGPDSIFLLPGYLVFSTLCQSPFSQFYIHFNLDVEISSSRRAPFLLPCNAEWKDMIDRICQSEFTGVEWQTYRELLVGELVHRILLSLPKETFFLDRTVDPIVDEVRCFLTNCLRVGYSGDNESISREIGIGVNSLIRRFKDSTGVTPQQYFKRIRIEYACELLHDDRLSIDQIARQSGFTNRYHFTRIFSELIGSGPASFRKRMKHPAPKRP